MGAAASSCTNGNGCFGINESDQVRLSRGIDKGLRETRRTLSNTSKVLLLGAGDSGKSTIIKQMRLINNVPFTEYEREIYRVQLFYNLVGGMRALLDALRDLPPLEEGDMIDANGVVVKANPNQTTNGNTSGDKKAENEEKEDGGSTPLPKFTNMDLLNAQSSEDDEDEESHTSSPAPRPSKLTPPDQRPKSTINPTTSTSPPTRSDATTEAHPTPNDQNLSTSDSTNNNNKDNNNDSNDPNRPPSRTPTRSPSISLNLFNPGSLTPRQLTLLNEFMYAPDLRPGQPFPLEFESMLREAWWGLTDEEWEQQHHEQQQQQQLQRNHSQNRGSQYVPNSPMGETHQHRARGRNTYHQQEEARTSQYMSRERLGAGSMLDRIERESGIALPDNLGYLYATPERLASFFEEDYMPSDDDILRCRCRTTGIQETVFSLGKALMGPNMRRKGSLGNITFKGGGGQSSNPTRSDPSSPDTPRNNNDLNRGDSPDPVPLKISVGKTKLHMVDVGGQRSERRKWIHCFQDVTAVLFLVGLSGYNQGLVEDPTANQMQDAMALWDGVCSSPWLKNTSLILFLNKTDLFAQKIGKFPISDYFPDYEGEKGDAKAGMDYFRRRFTRVAAKSIRAARQSRTRKDSRAVTTDSSTVVGSTNSRSKSKHRDDSNKFGIRSNNKDETAHIATNTTSSHGAAALSFDSPRRPIGLSSSTSRIPSGSGSGSGVNVRGGDSGPKKGKDKEILKERSVYTHFTNATDTSQLRVVIVAVCDIILRDNFAQANLI